MKKIGYVRTDFPDKFGIPRQSGLVETQGEIIFEPEYRNMDAFRGLEEFDYIWILWEFSEVKKENWSATVRPPRLGGNKRMGVFATRSPFRPNPIGLSSVQLLGIELHPKWGPVLKIQGADLMDGTPIYDIKPYLPHVDSHPGAKGGFALEKKEYGLQAEITEDLLQKVPEEKRKNLIGILEQDPRPSYQKDPKRVYGFFFAGMEIKFRVEGEKIIVVDVL